MEILDVVTKITGAREQVSPKSIIPENKQRSSAADDNDDHVPEEFSKLGIKLSYLLNEFIEQDCGGRSYLTGLSTADVCNTFVKPATNACKMSYCDMLLERQNHEREQHNNNVMIVGRADVFVSHAWKYEFLLVLSALEDHFKDKPDTIIWFDLFSNNQHRASVRPYEWWQTVFKSAIDQIGHTVMVLSPWNDPIPYTRAWCIFEAYCTLKTNCRFEIAMSAHDCRQFIIDTEKDPFATINTMLGSINAEKSTAFLPEDRDRIFEVIRNEVGFSKINTLIFEQLRTWVINQAKQKLETNKDKERQPKLHNMLGMLYMGQGNYRASCPLLEKCLKLTKDVFGPDHPDTLTAMNNLASLYKAQGKAEAAETLYVDCLERTESAYGPGHLYTLERMLNMVGFYYDRGKVKVAENFVMKNLAAQDLPHTPTNRAPATAFTMVNSEKIVTIRGPNALDRLGSIRDLVLMYRDKGKLEVAEALYVECLEKRRVTLGPNHPYTLESMSNLASFYRKQGKDKASEALHMKCKEKRKYALGTDHPDTLASINSLACVYAKRPGSFLAAEKLYLECLDKRKTARGPGHPETLATMSDLASLYVSHGKYKTAEVMFMECLEKRKALLRPDHPDTLSSMYNLGMVYDEEGKYQAAEAFYVECLKKRRATLGPDHADTINSMNKLTDVYTKQGKYKPAVKLQMRNNIRRSHEKRLLIQKILLQMRRNIRRSREKRLLIQKILILLLLHTMLMPCRLLI